MLVNCAQAKVCCPTLASARLAFSLILRLGVGKCLPLEIGNRIRSAAGERLDVIFSVARTGAAGLAGQRAGMLALKFAGNRTGSVLFR